MRWSRYLQWVGGLVLFAVLFLSGCQDKEGADVGIVINNLCPAEGSSVMSFGTGLLEGGRAVLYQQENAAYWVKDGKAYVVNEEAKRLSPKLDPAPASITYEAVLGVVDALPGDTECDASTHFTRGFAMPEQEVAKREASLQQAPEDLETRRLLLGYYFKIQHRSPEGQKKHADAALWFIKNRPKDPVSGTPMISLYPDLDGTAYTEARKLWEEHLQKNPSDLVLLRNAADFARLHDLDFAVVCLRKSIALMPNRPEWHQKLAFCYSLHARPDAADAAANAQLAFAEMETALSLTQDADERSSLLEEAAEFALNAGKDPQAKAYAEELLKNTYSRAHWDYGNAVHHGNIILGRLALKQGDVAQAKQYLINAGRTPGSPELNSFGPDLELAKALLERGEKDVVIEYLDLCAKFWDTSSTDAGEGEKQIPQWKRMIQEGKTPSF